MDGDVDAAALATPQSFAKFLDLMNQDAAKDLVRRINT
jgi:hypothetical protein